MSSASALLRETVSLPRHHNDAFQIVDCDVILHIFPISDKRERGTLRLPRPCTQSLVSVLD